LVFAGAASDVQIIGQTDRTASRATTEPYTPANLCATILQTVFGLRVGRSIPTALPAEIANWSSTGPIAGLL